MPKKHTAISHFRNWKEKSVPGDVPRERVLNWSLNNYIGLANDPEVRKVDAEAPLNGGCLPDGSPYDERSDFPS